mmetsp:Transcript_70938/g.112414  ORF Transcript_70938/g.112414 Transcript_70938/m.112414 type:complete len:126 (-) Transcript_70938:121-498(-)
MGGHLKCGSKPLWGGLTGLGGVLLLAGGIMFATQVGTTCCDGSSDACNTLKQWCEQNSNNGYYVGETDCDNYKPCSEVVPIIVGGVALGITGIILMAVFSCGVCVCCCFAASGPAPGGAVVGQPV